MSESATDSNYPTWDWQFVPVDVEQLKDAIERVEALRAELRNLFNGGEPHALAYVDQLLRDLLRRVHDSGKDWTRDLDGSPSRDFENAIKIVERAARLYPNLFDESLSEALIEEIVRALATFGLKPCPNVSRVV